MNTQAHLLLAAALLWRAHDSRRNSNALAIGAQEPFVHDTTIGRSHRAENTFALLGAIVPDISIFVMFGLARLRGLSHEVIWGELYYSAFWQNVGAITNSIPLFAVVALAGLAFHKYTSLSVLGAVLKVFGLAALIHCLADLPLHVDDGHAHFWPFSGWVYASSVSYWDPNHYGRIWLPIEFFIACICVVVLWRRFVIAWIRAVVIIVLLSYPAMVMFWFFSIR